MNRIKLAAFAAPFALLSLTAKPAFAAEDVEALKQQLKTLEARINQLEETKTQSAPVAVSATAPSNPNAFNPAIGLVLNGTYGAYSQKNNNIAGFAVGDEGERGDEGFSLGESELSVSANIDDLFAGNFVGSFNTENEVEIEEAFVQSIGLPAGINVKAGRMLANLGYMNEKHAHTDDFADRPLPYRAFLNSAFNDDGVQTSIILPTDIYSEIGAGAWRGDDFPGAEAEGSGPGAYSAYARIGDDIGDDQTWRLGASYLHSDANGDGRITGEAGAEQAFKGKNNLYIADAKYTWAPTGNAQQQELSLQGEYFWRQEDGTYSDATTAINDTPYDGSQSGYYGQAVYKFDPQWRAGYRYTALSADDVPAGLVGSALDSNGQDPYIHSAMVDFTNSEFSRIRLQYNNDHSGAETDNQFLVQYIMNLGAHGAHKY